MSWIERINEEITIETGDGSIWSPTWMNAAFEVEYNISVFNFRNVAGSLVTREQPMGRKFSFEIYFQGESNLDISEQFRIAAADKRFWRIQHPFYDEILVHPRSLRFENRDYNVTKISGLLLETIVSLNDSSEVSTVNSINAQKVELDAVSSKSFGDQSKEIQAAEISLMDANLVAIESSAEGLIESTEDAATFRNKVNDARNELNNILVDATQSIQKVQEVINYPFLVVSSVRSSVKNLAEQFRILIESVGNLTDLSRNNRVYVETMGSAMVSGAAAATVSQLENSPYESREEVDLVTLDVITLYNDYVDVLDGMQTDIQSDVDSYAPDVDVVRSVQDVVFFSISKLAAVALDSAQEFTVVNDADSNPVNLTHEFYGLDNEDENLDKFIRTNNIGLNELLLIKKDRELVYYI